MAKLHHSNGSFIYSEVKKQKYITLIQLNYKYVIISVLLQIEYSDVWQRIGKSSYGWFMGFKLYLIINNKGQAISIKITKGNTDDCSFVSDLAKNLEGKIFGDKGYISKDLFTQLFKQGLSIFTNLRKDEKSFIRSRRYDSFKKKISY